MERRDGKVRGGKGSVVKGGGDKKKVKHCNATWYNINSQ